MYVAENMNQLRCVTVSMQSRPPLCRSPNISMCASAAPTLCAVCVNLT